MSSVIPSLLVVAVWCSFCDTGTWAQGGLPHDDFTTSFLLPETQAQTLTTDNAAPPLTTGNPIPPLATGSPAPPLSTGSQETVLTTGTTAPPLSTGSQETMLTTSSPAPSLTPDNPVASPPVSFVLETWLKDHVSENETVVDLVCDETVDGSLEESGDGPSAVTSALFQTNTLAYYTNVEHLSITGCEDVVLEENSVPAQVKTVILTLITNLEFREGWHQKATHLRTLNVTFNKLKSIKVCDILSLVSVDLSNNHLVDVDFSSCGKHLEALQSLRLVQNELQTLLLCSSPNLESIDASRNRLTDVTEAYAGCLHDASKLRTLLLANNNITAFSSCYFPALEALDLSSNGLTTLDLSTCMTHSIHTLLLAHNLLTDVEVPKSVRRLDLSHNLLKELFHLSRNIIEADFSHNKLKKLGKNSFRRSRKLVHLNLAFNELTHIKDAELVGLSHVQELDISHNQLLQLGSFALAPLKKLRNLRMQHNQLTYVHARTFEFVPEDARLHMADNPWMCSCQLLSYLQSTVKRHCGSKCKSEVTLYCEERGTRHLATDILYKCLQTVAQINRDREMKKENATTHRNNRDHGNKQPYPSVLTPYLHPRFDPDMDPNYDPESDEDQSEEMRKLDAANAAAKNEETHFVMVVPALVVLVICVGVGVLTHRMYKKRRHLGNICSRFSLFGLAPGTAQKVPDTTGDSDSETEL